ncbi:MAG: type II secretion system F family protein [Micrococcales bacterium]|nr:type II secretion system F family protein [Micrococcales bacterium]
MTPGTIAALLGATLVLGLVTVSMWQSERARTRTLLDNAEAGPSGAVGRLGYLDRKFRGTSLGRRIGLLLAGAGLASVSPFTFSLGSVAGALFVAVVVEGFLGQAVAVVVFGVVLASVRQWLLRQQSKRIEAFIGQLPDLARLLSNGASAGLGLRRSLELAARELAEPARTEVHQVSSELALGESIQRSLGHMHERLPSRELSVLMHTLVIQQRAGGALVMALSRIAATLEERKQLRREVRTAATGSSFSGYTVILMGGFAVVVMNLMSPGVIDKMLGMLLGQIALALAVGFFVAGFLLLRRVGKVDV